LATAGANPRTVVTKFAVDALGRVFERGPTVALGEWQTFAYAAGNFTAGGSMTWTVDDADEIVTYTLVGKTMFVAFRITTSTLGGSADPQLKLTLPGGFTANGYTQIPINIYNGGVYSYGLAAVNAGETFIRFYKDGSAATPWTLETNLTNLIGSICFEVQ
jgi:hypothetical protein